MKFPAKTGKPLSLVCLLSLLSALVLSGCSGGSSTPIPTPAANSIASIAVSPAAVMPGQSATLTWSSQNATSCTASGAWSGTLGTSGSTTVTLQAKAAQTYTVTCSGDGLPGEKSVILDLPNKGADCAVSAAVRAHSGRRTAHRSKMTGSHS